MFEDYYKNILEKSPKLYHNYCGITRKEYPKWEGWKLISSYKEKGININDIDDVVLDTLVCNFYRLKYMKETLVSN